MAKKIIRIYRDEKATEINERMEKLLFQLEEYECGIEEELSDITIDEINRTDRDPLDLLNNYQDCCRFLELKTIHNVIAPIIYDLKDCIYSDMKEEHIEENTPIQKTIQPYLGGKKARVWLGKEVKPLILKGITKQKDVAGITGVNASTINNRVNSGYQWRWDEFVEAIIDGII